MARFPTWTKMNSDCKRYEKRSGKALLRYLDAQRERSRGMAWMCSKFGWQNTSILKHCFHANTRLRLEQGSERGRRQNTKLWWLFLSQQKRKSILSNFLRCRTVKSRSCSLVSVCYWPADCPDGKHMRVCHCEMGQQDKWWTEIKFTLQAFRLSVVKGVKIRQLKLITSRRTVPK